MVVYVTYQDRDQASCEDGQSCNQDDISLPVSGEEGYVVRADRQADDRRVLGRNTGVIEAILPRIRHFVLEVVSD